MLSALPKEPEPYLGRPDLLRLDALRLALQFCQSATRRNQAEIKELSAASDEDVVRAARAFEKYLLEG